MKRALLSLVVLAASGGYVWAQYGKTQPDDSLEIGGADVRVEASAGDQALPAVPASDVQSAPMTTASIAGALPAATPVAEPPTVMPAGATPRARLAGQKPAGPSVSALIAAAASQPMPPIPRAKPAPAATVVVEAAATAPKPQSQPQGQYRDGSYRGPAANAYYGFVQVQAVIKGGALVSVKVLQYPSDRNTSRYINAHALPVLQREAIRAQSARVNAVSGATLTSGAYIKSLSAALAQGRSNQASL